MPSSSAPPSPPGFFFPSSLLPSGDADNGGARNQQQQQAQASHDDRRQSSKSRGRSVNFAASSSGDAVDNGGRRSPLSLPTTYSKSKKWRHGGGWTKKGRGGGGGNNSGDRSGPPDMFDERDEEMDIVRQGNTETALLSSTNREEIETSIPAVMLASNDDVRLDDVDEKSILHDILFGRGLAGTASADADDDNDGIGAALASVPLGNERLYYHGQPIEANSTSKRFAPPPRRPTSDLKPSISASAMRAAPISFSAMVANMGSSGRSNTVTSPPPAAAAAAPSSSAALALGSNGETSSSLHAICEDSKTIQEFLERATAHLSTREAGSQDGEGRTPLHCLSLNSNLARATLTREHKLLLERADDPDAARNHGTSGAASAAANDATRRDPTGGGATKAKHPAGSASKTLFPDLHPTYSEDSNNSLLEHDLVDFIVTDFWRAYRPAMITPDRYGYIPFQEALTDWVKEAHCTRESSSAFSPGGRASFWAKTNNFRSRWNANASGGSKNDLSPPGSVEPPRSLSPSPTGRSGLMGRVVVQPFPKVRLTPHAIFCFTVLSAMIDRVEQRVMLNGGKPYPRRAPPSSHGDGILASGGMIHAGDEVSGRDPTMGDQHALHVAVHKLRTMTVEDIGSEIVQSIASIPDLIKTVMLIEDSQQREYVLSTLIMRRILVSKYSVGGWLTRMLSSVNKRVSDRGIDYLRIVSDSELFESNAPKSQGSWRRSKSFTRSGSNMSSSDGDTSTQKKNVEQEDLYNEISNLQDFVPSLLALGERDVEDAATTLVVKKVLDQLITRPFAATVILCDALLLVLLITGLRVATNHLLLGAPKNTVVNYLYIANTGLFYFIMRELGKAVSLLMVTKRARVYFWSFWNLCDMVSTFLALASVISVRQFCNSGATYADTNLRNLLSVTTGFLWLRVLSYLKGINEQLATFVLCILTIVRDVTWFCIILLTLVIAFAQMFFTILVPAYCADPTAPEQNGECTPSEYYLNAYSLLLGNFGNYNRADFDTVFSVFLAVFFTFVITLVLLNVLIAVANDSYEKCLLRSANLFGRARVMLIAELVSFQNLLRRNVDESRAPRRVYNAWWSIGINGWSRGSLMYFALTIIIAVVWVTYDVTGIFYGEGYGNVLLGLGSILINVLIFVGIMILLSTGAIDISRRTKNSKVTSSEDDPRPKRLCGDRYGNFLQTLIMRLLGSSSSSKADEYHADSWHGRLTFLQNEMARIADESNEETTTKLKALESVIQQTDSRLRGELTSLELSIAELKADLQKALAKLR